MTVEYREWIATLPKCVGDEGGCDGDLVGEDHSSNCPLFGKGFATLEDAFEAGRKVEREAKK